LKDLDIRQVATAGLGVPAPKFVLCSPTKKFLWPSPKKK